MTPSISRLSYLDTGAYQKLSTKPAPSSDPSADAGSAAVSAKVQLEALQKQGDFKSFFQNSAAVALLAPSDGTNNGTPANTLLDTLLQQVLGAYRAPAQSTAGVVAFG